MYNVHICLFYFVSSKGVKDHRAGVRFILNLVIKYTMQGTKKEIQARKKYLTL